MELLTCKYSEILCMSVSRLYWQTHSYLQDSHYFFESSIVLQLCFRGNIYCRDVSAYVASAIRNIRASASLSPPLHDHFNYASCIVEMHSRWETSLLRRHLQLNQNRRPIWNTDSIFPVISFPSLPDLQGESLISGCASGMRQAGHLGVFERRDRRQWQVASWQECNQQGKQRLMSAMFLSFVFRVNEELFNEWPKVPKHSFLHLRRSAAIVSILFSGFVKNLWALGVSARQY